MIDILEASVCSCPFYRKYMLPCWHIFFMDLFIDEGFITDNDWNTFTRDWKECGYEIYYAQESVYSETESYPEISNEKFKETLEQLTNFYYKFKNEDQLKIAFDDLVNDCLRKVQALELSKSSSKE